MTVQASQSSPAEIINAVAGGLPQGSGPASAGELKSNDAYMLIYSKVGSNFNSCTPGQGSEENLPEHTRRMVETMQQEQAERAQQAHARREKLHVRSGLALYAAVK